MLILEMVRSGIAVAARHTATETAAADQLVHVFHASLHKIRIHLSVAISTALHGEPSAPDRFRGAAFRK